MKTKIKIYLGLGVVVITLLIFTLLIFIGKSFSSDNHIEAEFGKIRELNEQKSGKTYEVESHSANGFDILKAGGATDKGDFYRADKRKIRLFRSLSKIVIWTKKEQSLDISAVNAFLDGQPTLELEKKESIKSFNILKTKKRMAPSELDNILRTLRQSNQFQRIDPVFINEETGKEMMVSSRIVVKLAEGISAEQIKDLHKTYRAQVVGHMHGTTDEIILDLGQVKAEEILNICEAYHQDPRVEWASPDFLLEIILL